MNIELPCKIGDTIYGIRNYRGTEHVQEGIASEMWFSTDMKLIIQIKHICRGVWGEKIFGTYGEAAEKIGGESKGRCRNCEYYPSKQCACVLVPCLHPEKRGRMVDCRDCCKYFKWRTTKGG